AGGPTLGRLLATSLDGLARSPWPAVWPAAAAGLLGAGCADLGSSLAALARQKAGRRPDADDGPWALSMAAVHDERPWYDGEEATAPAAAEAADHAAPADAGAVPDAGATADAGVVPDAGATAEGGERDDESHAAGAASSTDGSECGYDEDHGSDEVHDDGQGHGTGEGDSSGEPPPDAELAGKVGLTPNFALQPGLPPPYLRQTMRLPVVRVRPADPEPGTGIEDAR
ncbi:MAG: hypothetical protein R2761_31330, partial [Acidimicrobiales bacterium]